MRANPILTLGFAAGALMLPGPILALGLGKLTVQSSIGQPLSARIELNAVSRQELETLSAKIAEPDLYRQNNLGYNGVLTRARTTIERGANGVPYIRVVTQNPVNEPFLDLMVELNWASGRLVRDYTFLLDPPGVAPTPVEPVAPVRVGAAPPRPAAPPPVAPAPAAAPVAQAAPAGGTYMVKVGDNLTEIAKDHKPSSVTLEQMLVALFNMNQFAFDGNNMSRLRAGEILKIPDAATAAATPPREATKIVHMQAADWRAYRDRVAGTAPPSEAVAGRTAGGRIGAAVVETTPAAPPGRDQLKVSRDAGPGKQVVGGTTEDMVAREREIKEAQTRIAELEKTLAELQRALELKNQTMGQLQTQAQGAKGGAAPAVEPAAAPAPKVAEAAKSEPMKSAEAPKTAEPAKAAEAPVAQAPAPAPKAAAAPPPPKPALSFFDDLMANTPTWAIGGGALVVLGGLAAILAARRRSSRKPDDAMAADTDIKTNTVFGSTGGGVVNTGENSLASEFSREGIGSIDTDEVDPIAEAEVYLAYGRDAQAEEILKHAVRKDPQRQEIYLKLLEIHAQHNKPTAFDAVAAELYSISKGQGETWQKAVALGRQLDPANPMFAAGATTRAPADADTQPLHETLPVQPERVAGAAAREAAPPAFADSAFDAKLDEDLAVLSPEQRAKSPADILAGAQSELEKTALGGPAGAVTAGGAAAEAPAGSIEAKIDAASADAGLDFHLDESEHPVPLKKAAPVEQSVRPEPAMDLDKLDLSFGDADAARGDETPSVLDGQWHDAATKLDLAKAYHEMGDVEGAREILQEVLREGDDVQKAEAQALIGKLG